MRIEMGDTRPGNPVILDFVPGSNSVVMRINDEHAEINMVDLLVALTTTQIYQNEVD